MAETRYTLRTYFRYTSWPIILAMLALMVFGVLAIRVYERSDPGVSGFAAKQAVLGAIALLGIQSTIVGLSANVPLSQRFVVAVNPLDPHGNGVANSRRYLDSVSILVLADVVHEPTEVRG